MLVRVVFDACPILSILQQLRQVVVTRSKCYKFIINFLQQLLEGLGVFKGDKKKQSEAYQDSVSVPINHSFDEDAVGVDDVDDVDEDLRPPSGDSQENLQNILSAIAKVAL